MKNLLVIFCFLSLISCQNKEEKTTTSIDETATKISGQQLFEGEGNCIACHKPDQKIIGPSLQDIAKIYKEKKRKHCTIPKRRKRPNNRHKPVRHYEDQFRHHQKHERRPTASFRRLYL